MTPEQINALVEKAKEYANNSFVPYTEVAVGACCLTEQNIIFGGAVIENTVPGASVGAAAVAVFKAVSEGETEIKAVCLYRDGSVLPYLSGQEREVILQFGKKAAIILANSERHELFRVYELMPFSIEERQ